MTTWYKNTKQWFRHPFSTTTQLKAIHDWKKAHQSNNMGFRNLNVLSSLNDDQY
jgi:hypothetical protein